jgi:hypothetical protein
MTETQTPGQGQTEKMPDVETIVPDVPTITLNGVECRVKRIQTRELLALLRIVSLAVGSNMAQMRFSLQDPSEVAKELAALLLLSASVNPDETLLFAAQLVDTVDEGQRVKLRTYLMENPDPNDMLLLMEQVATQESGDLVAIAGKVQAMMTRLTAVYQPTTATKSQRGGGGRSRAPST